MFADLRADEKIETAIMLLKLWKIKDEKISGFFLSTGCIPLSWDVLDIS